MISDCNSDHGVELQLVTKWIREVGELALNLRATANIRLKTDNTIVTDVDHAIEDRLLDKIAEHYPNHSVLSEEGRLKTNNSKYLWIIDPIDGTRAFASGLPFWAISIGIFYDRKPHAGFLFLPETKELYWGTSGQAYYDNRPLARVTAPTLLDSLAFIAVPSNAHILYELEFPRVRSFGSTAIHLAYVARGIATAALTRRAKIWDIAGILPLLTATGITLEYLSGKPLETCGFLSGSSFPEPLIAAPASIMKAIRESIQVKSTQK